MYRNIEHMSIVYDKQYQHDRQILNKQHSIKLKDEGDLTEMFCKKMFLDTMTNMVSKEVCFKDEYQHFIFKFQYIINKVFNDLIGLYILNTTNEGKKLAKDDILFLYKGGTTMKLLYNKYTNIMKEKGLDAFFDNIIKNFERSDSDYSILINPKINEEKCGISFKQIYRDINWLVTIALDVIRNIFNNYPNIIVPLNLITDDILREKIKEQNKMIDLINNSDRKCTNINNIQKIIGIEFKGRTIMAHGEQIPNLTENMIDNTFASYEEPDNKEFINTKAIATARADFLMSLDENNAKYYKEISQNKNDIYLSINEANEYINNGVYAYFSLQRLKINFIIYYKSIDGKYGYFYSPSELVDVSILKKEASGLSVFFKHKDQEYITYQYKLGTDPNSPVLNYSSYTIYGHISDLMFTLFDVSKYPWDDAKYIKRLKRILFFIILELVIYTKKSLYIINLIKGFLKNVHNMKLMISHAESELHKVKNKEYLGTFIFFDKMKKLTEYDDYTAQYNKMKIMNDEMIMLLNFITQVPEQEYIEDIHIPMLGGYKKKALKYIKKLKINM
jgi:hypothetical protein